MGRNLTSIPRNNSYNPPFSLQSFAECYTIATTTSTTAKPKKRSPASQKVIHKGFVYHLRLQHNGKTRYTNIF